jgi:hypothetical protein
MSVARKATAAVAGSLLMVGAMAAPSQAVRPITVQDGLVNVSINDVTLIDNTNISVVDAVDVVVQACGIEVGPLALAVLGQAIAVDNSGRDSTICETATGGDVTITQN